MNYKQTCVDLMGETLFTALENTNDEETMKALYSEWVVDDQDPEDGSYEFLFINDLSQV